MIKDINKAVKLVEEQLIKINHVDNSMSTIFNTFAIKNIAEKEASFSEYKLLIDERNDLLVPIEEVQEYLSQVIRNLDKVKLKFYDKYGLKRKVKDMASQIKESVEFQDEEVPEIKVNLTK